MLIAMACWNTVENQRYDLTVKTIDSLLTQVNPTSHPIYIVNNASTDPRTAPLLERLSAYGRATIITNETNLGTARAINKAWKFRKPGQCCVKMDDDVIVHQKDWPDVLEEVFRREHKIGIAALKRNDLSESPDHPEAWAKSKLIMLPHNPGERWMVVEQVSHCMGTCQAYSSALLDRMGYLYQMQDEVGNPGYAFDDSLSAVRCYVAGFISAFVPYIPIDHIDPGGTPYTTWKQDVAGKQMSRFNAVRDEYLTGKRPIYWEDKD
jgi:glycosyltransferase involved in cell wall biosynthesis